MAKITIDKAAGAKIDEAFNKAEPWAAEICMQLRQWIHETVPGVTEDWKWGPNFQYHGMCFGIWHFKKHVSFIFYNGAVLEDPHQLLIHGKDNLHNRMMKFTPAEKPVEEIVKMYIAAAAEANVKGLKAEKKRELPEMKPYFTAWLKENDLETKFASYSAACQREYYLYIDEAKKEETKLRRFEKIKPMLEKQIKPNEKYTK